MATSPATSPLIWIGFNAAILPLLAFDLGVLHRRPHTVSVAEALKLSAFYILLAIAFNIGLFHVAGTEAGLECRRRWRSPSQPA